MNKRQKKKSQSFKSVTNKQMIRNQRNTIRQLNSKIERLEEKYDNLQITADIRAERIKIMENTIAFQSEQIAKLKTPWWKRGSKRG